MSYNVIQGDDLRLDRVDGGWHNRGMTNRIDHRLCDHPATKAARAACRRRVDAFFAPTAEDLARAELTAAEGEWKALKATAHPGQVLSADLNADDTSREEGFEVNSLAWYRCAISTLAMLLDTGENNYPDIQYMP